MEHLAAALARIFLALVFLQFSTGVFADSSKDEAQAHYEKGKELLYSGSEGVNPHIDETINAFETAIRIDPDLVEAYLLLSDAYGYLLVPLEYQSAEWKEIKQKSDDLIRKAVEIAPENTEALMYYSSLVKDRAEYLEIYRKIIEIDPDHPEAHARYAHILNLVGRKDEAIEEYWIHVRINDKENNGFIHTEVIGIMWDLLTEQNRKDEAVDLMKRFLGGPLPPAVIYTTLRNTIDTSAYTEEKYQDVIMQVNQFKSYGDDTYFRRARGALSAGQMNGAMESFARHIEINPFNPRYYNEFARSLINRGHYKEAYDVYESLLDTELSKSQKCSQLGNLRLRVDFIGPDRSLPKKLVSECGHEVVIVQ